MEPQSANAVLLVRPANFGFNAEAAESNVFAHAPSDANVQRKALAEFEGLARRLADSGIEVLVLDDSREPAKPDAVFPNNWFTTHADGTLVLYPMATAARRLERRADVLREMFESAGFDIRRVVDLSRHEDHGQFLEGTGSLVFDRSGRRAFASSVTSKHTTAMPLTRLSSKSG